MHPDIYSFWEKQGYQLAFDKQSGIWQASKDNEKIEVAYKSFLTVYYTTYPDYYIWNNKYISEKHMLKLVRMKAFL